MFKKVLNRASRIIQEFDSKHPFHVKQSKINIFTNFFRGTFRFQTMSLNQK